MLDNWTQTEMKICSYFVSAIDWIPACKVSGDARCNFDMKCEFT